MFNLKNGKADGTGNLWRADDWIHMNIDCGMLSIFMPEDELLTFIEFLAHIPLHKDGYEKYTKNYHYQAENHDTDSASGDACVNVFIGDKTLVILNINLPYIPALMSYLYEHREG